MSQRKLTDAQAKQLREKYIKRDVPVKDLAEQYKISTALASIIVNNEKDNNPYYDSSYNETMFIKDTKAFIERCRIAVSELNEVNHKADLDKRLSDAEKESKAIDKKVKNLKFNIAIAQNTIARLNKTIKDNTK